MTQLLIYLKQKYITDFEFHLFFKEKSTNYNDFKIEKSQLKKLLSLIYKKNYLPMREIIS